MSRSSLCSAAAQFLRLSISYRSADFARDASVPTELIPLIHRIRVFILFEWVVRRSHPTALAMLLHDIESLHAQLIKIIAHLWRSCSRWLCSRWLTEMVEAEVAQHCDSHRGPAPQHLGVNVRTMATQVGI